MVVGNDGGGNPRVNKYREEDNTKNEPKTYTSPPDIYAVH